MSDVSKSPSGVQKVSKVSKKKKKKYQRRHKLLWNQNMKPEMVSSSSVSGTPMYPSEATLTQNAGQQMKQKWWRLTINTVFQDIKQHCY